MPGITRENVGTCTPGELLFAINLFNGKYEEGGLGV